MMLIALVLMEVIILCKRINSLLDSYICVLATLAAFVAINEFKPDLLLNAGTCGGFKRVGASIGDAFISTSFKNHDRRIQIPGFVEYGRGTINSLPTPNLIKVDIM